MRAARDSWLNPALALVVCVVAGALCDRAGVPLPWMTGPLLAMAGCNFAGVGLRAPPGGRGAGQIVIGLALGLYFTPAVAREVLSHWPLLVLAACLALLLGALGAWVLVRASRIDGITAFLASVPGGATEMTVLGERLRARVDRVVLAQSLRVLIVVLVVPAALTYAGAPGSAPRLPADVTFTWHGTALWLAIGAGAAWGTSRTGMANAFFFGPLVASVALTVSGVAFSAIPTPVTNGAQLLLGCALGTRFERRSLARAPQYVSAVLISVLLALAVAAAAGWLAAAYADMPPSSLILAFAPGGIAEMCVTAKVLQLGVPFVTAAHVTRVLVLVMLTAPIVRAFGVSTKRVHDT